LTVLHSQIINYMLYRTVKYKIIWLLESVIATTAQLIKHQIYIASKSHDLQSLPSYNIFFFVIASLQELFSCLPTQWYLIITNHLRTPPWVTQCFFFIHFFIWVKKDCVPNFSFLCCSEMVVLWLETKNKARVSMKLMASLAPAQA
jgi:hypothetical protein